FVFLCFFSSRRRHTRSKRDWSSDVCSSDLAAQSVDRRHPGWRPEVVHSQAAAVIAEAVPGASLAQFLEVEQAGVSDCRDEAMLVELIAASERMMAHYAAMQSDFISELMRHR